jgi:hypothetical protein
MRSDPTTVRPPFDPEAFARESETNIRTSLPVAESSPPPASARPTVPPPPGLPVYSAAVGGSAVPVLVLSRDDLEWFDLSPVAREVLALVNGEDTIGAICARSGLALDDVVETLEDLARDGVVVFV